MKTVIIAIVILGFNKNLLPQNQKPTISFTTGDDSIAYSIIERNLEIIKKCTETKQDSVFLDTGNIIGFIIELTGIVPDSFYNNIQRPIRPTEYDYRKWEVWYILNKQNIYWDKKNKLILLRKSLNPYIPIRHS